MSTSLIRSGQLVSTWTWMVDTTYSIGTAGVAIVRDRRHGKYLAHSKLSMRTRDCSVTVHFGSCALASTQMSPCIDPLQESKKLHEGEVESRQSRVTFLQASFSLYLMQIPQEHGEWERWGQEAGKNSQDVQGQKHHHTEGSGKSLSSVSQWAALVS